jgi:4-hydroxybenzoate polyprenyltransferase
MSRAANVSSPQLNEALPNHSTAAVSWIALLRPLHWSKNAFVFAPFLFTEAAQNLDNFLRTSACFGAFCLAASSVYILNDVLDVDADRSHPRKRRRPIAAGTISVTMGLAVAVAMALISILWAWSLGRFAGAATAAYIGNGVVYTVWLKHHVLADVISIAIGFLLRLLGGCAAIHAEPSSWLLVCGFSVALFLGFGKRRTEIENLGADEHFRSSLRDYSAAKLDTVLAITAALSLLSYMLFTTAPETVARHGTNQLIFTTVFVAYGLFRFLFKVQEGKGDGPTDVLGKDPVFFINGFLWAASVYVILHVLH